MDYTVGQNSKLQGLFLSDASETGEVTMLLRAARGGNASAESALIARVYPRLRRIARGMMSRERCSDVLQPTALVHEAYLRMVGDALEACENRTHFFAIAARVMRQVLVDNARTRGAEKRGGDLERIELEDAIVIGDNKTEQILEVDRLLRKLSTYDKRQEQIVEMKVFAGLTDEEVATVLGTSIRTVKRDWSMAKAWLYGQLAHKTSSRAQRGGLG